MVLAFRFRLSAFSLFHCFHQRIKQHKFVFELLLMRGLQSVQVYVIILTEIFGVIGIVLYAAGNPLVWRIDHL
jgi:hypothetical protein